MVQRTSNAEVMSMDLSPKMPAKAYGGDGGSYYEWSPADLPMLGVASIGAAKLSLTAGGMSLPSYSDSAKVAYVLQGIMHPTVDPLLTSLLITQSIVWVFPSECDRSQRVGYWLSLYVGLELCFV
jgi:hypothetical protein